MSGHQESAPPVAAGRNEVILNALLYGFDVLVVLVVAGLFWRMLA